MAERNLTSKLAMVIFVYIDTSTQFKGVGKGVGTALGAKDGA